MRLLEHVGGKKKPGRRFYFRGGDYGYIEFDSQSHWRKQNVRAREYYDQLIVFIHYFSKKGRHKLLAISATESIMHELLQIEDRIESIINQESKLKVLSKIDSGILLIKLNHHIKSTKKTWELEAPKLFIDCLEREIGKSTARWERMTVAKIEDSKQFANLKWCNLVEIASHINLDKIKKIEDFLIKYNLNNTNFEYLTEKETARIVNVAITKHKLSVDKIKISDELLHRAIDRKLKFDKKTINQLKQGNAEEKVRLMVDYGYQSKNSTKSRSKKYNLGNLENMGLSFCDVLKNACLDPDSAWIEMATLDDIAHWVGKLYQIKEVEY